VSAPAQLGQLLHAFFEDYLLCQRGLSALTIRSYSDSIRLFLGFVASKKRCKLTRLSLLDLTSDRVLQFLDHLEQERGNAIASRNQRLAALRSFFEFVATRQPERLFDAQRVAAVPIKRCQPPRTHFIERDEIETLFKQLAGDRKGRFALRDRTLLMLLYNTGAHVQEVAELKIANLEMAEKSRIRLHGKGDKWRVCQLWKQTAELLIALVAGCDNPEAAVFASRGGKALTRHGLYKIVRRHTCSLQHHDRVISPHTFRHTAAVHLLESGVEVNVIRAWLGHVSLETTNRYAEITLRMKAEALEACSLERVEPGKSHRNPRWRNDPALLKWLKSL